MFYYFVEGTGYVHNYRQTADEYSGFVPFAGWTVQSEEDLDPSTLYFDQVAQVLRVKPDSPGPDYYWDTGVNLWLKVLQPLREMPLFQWLHERRHDPSILADTVFLMYLEQSGATLSYREKLSALEALMTGDTNVTDTDGDPSAAGSPDHQAAGG